MYRIIIFFLFQVSVFSILSAQETIYVKVQPGDATPRLQNAIEQARHLKGKKVVIQLEQGNYDLYRNSSSKQVYFISNTASKEEYPDPLSPPVFVSGLNCTKPKGVHTPGKVLPNPRSVFPMLSKVVAPIIGFT